MTKGKQMEFYFVWKLRFLLEVDDKRICKKNSSLT